MLCIDNWIAVVRYVCYSEISINYQLILMSIEKKYIIFLSLLKSNNFLWLCSLRHSVSYHIIKLKYKNCIHNTKMSRYV